MANGTIAGETYLTAVLTTPRGDKWHAGIAADPTPTGLTKALRAYDFDVDMHLLAKAEMLTIRNLYEM